MGIGLGAAFDRARFVPAGAQRDEIGGEAGEQAGPDAAALGTRSRLRARGGEAEQRVEGAGETQPVQGHRVLARGAGHDRAHKVVRDEEGEQFAVDHRRAFAMQCLEAEHGFEVVQAEFDAPAAQVGRRDFSGRIRHGVEQCRDEDKRAGAPARLFHPQADDAHRDFFRQRGPLRRVR